MRDGLILVAGLGLLASAPVDARPPCGPLERERPTCTPLPMAVAVRPCPPLGPMPPMAIGARDGALPCGTQPVLGTIGAPFGRGYESPADTG